MLDVAAAFKQYATAVHALPWPASMRTDAKAVQAAAIDCSLSYSALSSAVGYDAIYATYSVKSLADFQTLATKITVLLGDF